MNVIDYKYNLQINNVKPARNDTKWGARRRRRI